MPRSISNDSKKKIIVVGGRFAGLNFAQRMFKDKNYQVTLVDKNNYNFFTPLLYQVATSFLDPSTISYPFRKLLRNRRLHFRMGELVKVDPVTQTIYLNDGVLSYDHLVFAAGARTNFYGIASIEKNAISLKGIDDALHMRNALMRILEQATITTDPAERKKLLTIVVAGGGPTGVEVAGMLAAYPKGHPQLAQPAMQQGKTLARNFIALSKGRPLKAFKYFDKGDMAIVGRHNAQLDMFKHKLHIGGFIALFVWLFIHLVSLVNYNNKLRTFYSWAIAYLTRDQALRMIFRSGSV